MVALAEVLREDAERRSVSIGRGFTIHRSGSRSVGSVRSAATEVAEGDGAKSGDAGGGELVRETAARLAALEVRVVLLRGCWVGETSREGAGDDALARETTDLGLPRVAVGVGRLLVAAFFALAWRLLSPWVMGVWRMGIAG